MVRFQSIWLARPPLTESGSWGRGWTGGGATNWKRNVGLADDDFAARLVGEPDLVGGADTLGLPLEGHEVGDPAGERDAAGHPVEEVQVVVGPISSKSLNCGGTFAWHDEHRLLARPDRHAGALLDDALFEDAAGGHEPDAQDLRAGRLLHGPHHRGHLTRTARRRAADPAPGPWFICDMRKAPFFEARSLRALDAPRTRSSRPCSRRDRGLHDREPREKLANLAVHPAARQARARRRRPGVRSPARRSRTHAPRRR